jgi:hypothetical protein
MHSDTILDSHLYIRLDLDHTAKANGKFEANASNKAYLGNQLLLYDRVVIPTKDFGIIPMLIRWMGLNRFREELERGTFGFARPKSLLGYAGNGNGISGFDIRPSEKSHHFEWWQEATFGSSLDRAIELQLQNQCESIGIKEHSKILQLILACSKPIDWDNPFFMKNIVHETYSDIMDDPWLSNFILLHESSGTKSVNVELPRLSGVGPNQLKVSTIGPIRDGVGLVLRIAEINLEIMMAQIYGNCDIGTSEGAEQIIKGKLTRAGIEPSAVSKFLSLLELTGIPNIGPAITSGSLELSKILDLRQKKVSQEFRKWLRNANASDARELERLYVESLGSTSFFTSLPVRILRFAVTTAVGLVHPIAGTVASAMDSFFIEKWLNGYSPKLFLNELGKLPKPQRRKI